MITYPKIQTLLDRDPQTHKVTSQIRLPEFNLIRTWLLTEKVDGTNIRVIWDGKKVEFRGRTDRAQLYAPLFTKLQNLFLLRDFEAAFDEPPVTFYGEGYGPGIQKGGGNYSPEVNFRLFDVRVGEWWLNWPEVEDVAAKFGIRTVPVLGKFTDFLPTCQRELEDILSVSIVAENENSTLIKPEGIVARTEPLLLLRNGKRLMWKIKFKDFEKEEK